MYIVEKLLADYPMHADDIKSFDAYLHRVFEHPEKFADTDKFNYKYIDAAYRSKPTNKNGEQFEYIKNMALYELSFNYDKDFLSQYIDKDVSSMSVDDIRKSLLQHDYNIEIEKRNKEKLGLE